MSTWTGITVGEFELCSMQDDYEQWYFRNSDRIRDIVGGDKDGDHRNSFIGFAGGWSFRDITENLWSAILGSALRTGRKQWRKNLLN